MILSNNIALDKVLFSPITDIFLISPQNKCCGTHYKCLAEVQLIVASNKRTMMVLYRSPEQTDLHTYC